MPNPMMLRSDTNRPGTIPEIDDSSCGDPVASSCVAPTEDTVKGSRLRLTASLLPVTTTSPRVRLVLTVSVSATELRAPKAAADAVMAMRGNASDLFISQA